MESTKLKRRTFKVKYVELICHPRDFLHGGGGPQIGEAYRPPVYTISHWFDSSFMIGGMTI